MDSYLNSFGKLLREMPPEDGGTKPELTGCERYDAMTHEQQIAFQRELLTGFKNVPDRYKNATLGNWSTPTQTHKAILESIRRYAAWASEDPGWSIGLVFHGAYGCGKTHLAIAVAKAISRPSRKAIFIDMADLAHELRKEMAADEGEGRRDIIEDLRSFPLAVIDDLGVERVTEYMASQLGSIIHNRYNTQGTITIFTSNLVWRHEFEEKYGKGNVSRIGEICKEYRLPNYDFRRAG